MTWAPWRTEARVLTSRGSIDQIAVDEVIAAAEALRGVKARGMSELGRLLRYSRPYTPHLLLSVLLMACVGAAQALTALLIGPIFDRVLNPASADAPVLLFTIPDLRTSGLSRRLDARVDPQCLDHGGGRDPGGVSRSKACAITARNYLINYVGFSAVTDLRQTVFDRVVHQDAHFFEANSTARVMSSIMNDLEKIQVALSHILADWLRQSFTALGLLAVVLQTDWKLAVREPDGAAFRAGADAAAGPPHPPDHAQRPGQRRRAESGAAGNPERPPGGEVVRRRRDRVQPLPRPRRAAAQQQSALRRAAGHRQSP